MHIPDGIVPPQVALGGYALAGGLMGWCLKQIEKRNHPQESIPKASLLTAAFFVASSIHIPVPPASVHLVLNGLLGAILGYYALPAIAISLFFQAVMFQHGGLSTLGINTLLMGVPALIAGYIFRLRFTLGFQKPLWTGTFGFLAGSIGVGLSATFFFLLIFLTLPADVDRAIEQTALKGLMIAHIPLIVLEGIFTAMVTIFLQRVKPELLEKS